jgi:hypothetical protein
MVGERNSGAGERSEKGSWHCIWTARHKTYEERLKELDRTTDRTRVVDENAIPTEIKMTKNLYQFKKLHRAHRRNCEGL